MKSPASSRSASRKVSPIQPLLVKKQVRVTIDLAKVDDQLSRLSVAPLAVKTLTPQVPVLRSCLRSSTAAKSSEPRRVRFVEYGGWNKHFVKAFTPDSAPNSFLSLADVTLIHPTNGRQKGTQYDGSYSTLLPQSSEIRWPPPEYDGQITEGHTGLPPSSCRACHSAASRGTPVTRYQAQNQSIWCRNCLSLPARRLHFTPALDLDDDDELDACPGPHHHTPETCWYYKSAVKANLNWLYTHYPERYDFCDAILDE